MQFTDVRFKQLQDTLIWLIARKRSFWISLGRQIFNSHIQFLSILLYSSMILLFSLFSSYSSWLSRLYNGFIHLRYDINQIYRPTFYNLKGTKFWWCSPGKLICAQIRLNVHRQMNQSLRSHSHSSFRVLSSEFLW